jgi:glutamate 5-kinase
LKESAKGYKRIVIKIGSSLLCAAENVFDDAFFAEIVGQISRLVSEAHEVAVVSSGAIALGMQTMGLNERPRQLNFLQAAAAIGQNELMNAYRKYFKNRGCNVAQVLLTWEDFSDRARYLNAKHTLMALLEFRAHCQEAVIPIINENDTVSVDEIKFGDNDRLSALVSALISADLLIILSDVDGLMDKNRKIIPVVDEITPQIRALACPTKKKVCVGGMITKIEAAKVAVDSGIPCVIACGHKKDILAALINDPSRYGTLFIPKKSLAERQRWIAFGTKPKGKIIVDEGARKALMNKKSLLSVGVVGIEGYFDVSDIVSLCDRQGNEFARGKVCISCQQLDKVKGSRFDKEVIHCDNMVIL